MPENQIKKIRGDISRDHRGSVSFVNDFGFSEVRRFYQVENAPGVIRAWHGHMKEAKFVYVASGSILICAVYLDDTKAPSKDNKVQKFILTAEKPMVLYIPPSFANGFKSLEPRSKVIFFSTSTLQESLEDDYRFPLDYWGEDIWKEEDV